VAVLICPYLFLQRTLVALALTLTAALIIVMLFSFYIAVARDLSFKHRFTEMAALSLGVAAVSFGIGFLVRHLLGVDI